MQPPSWIDILLLPLLLTLFAGILLGFALNSENATGKTGTSWYIGLALGALAFVDGVSVAWQMRDAFYRASLYGSGMKVVLAHYAAPILPALVVGIAVGVHLYWRKRSQEGF